MWCSRTGARLDGALLLIAALALAAGAEPSGDDYRSERAAPATVQERARLAAELEVARRREAEQAAAREAAERAEAARRAALLAQRPLAERLTEARCTACHTLAIVEQQTLGPVGWRWTVERMRWWHGAALESGDAATIAQHLAARYPVATGRSALEIGLALVALLALPAVVLGWARRRRERRGRRGDSR